MIAARLPSPAPWQLCECVNSGRYLASKAAAFAVSPDGTDDGTSAPLMNAALSRIGANKLVPKTTKRVTVLAAQ